MEESGNVKLGQTQNHNKPVLKVLSTSDSCLEWNGRLYVEVPAFKDSYYFRVGL